VANVNPANAWLLRDRETALVVEPSPTLLSEALEMLLGDVPLRQRLARAGEQLVRTFAWDDQIDRVYRFMSAPGAPPP